MIEDLVARYPKLVSAREQIEEAAKLLIESVESGGKILICGNGGSSADADHIVGELMKGFILPRPLSQNQKEALSAAGGETGRQMGDRLQQGIPALSLSAPTALNTAFLNDVDPSLLFAQQVMGMGNKGDILWGISTSGNSSNIVAASIAAKARGLKTLAMTGEKKSSLSQMCDVCIRVNVHETYKVQELHLPVYHTLCLVLENHFFKDGPR
ncbi:MAG: phosphoheptose isomerase [Spirochaetaceae bacterium 4572_59]|nr:MAG: phosphoheptose isomerase [Spirochaetaceae bacterium 4572_59]